MENKKDFKPQDGDIIVLHSMTSPVVLMFKQMSDDGKSCYCYAACSLRADSPFESGVYYKNRERFIDARPATEKERGFFQRRLKMDGITYNGYHKLMKSTDYPDVGQTYYYIDSSFCVCEDIWGRGGSEQQFRFNAGNCFFNRPDAEDLQYQIKGIVRDMKKEKNKNDKRNNLI